MKVLSKCDARILSILLAVSILLGSIPLSEGIIVRSYPKQPAFTLNICAPLQSGLAGSMTTIARPATSSLGLVLMEYGKLWADLPNSLTEPSRAPESPPPKARI